MAAAVSIKGAEAIDKDLRQLPIEARGQAVKAGLRTAGRAFVKVAKQIVPQPGYPGDNEDLKPLRDTLGTLVKEYAHSIVAINGARGREGAHAHLIELGHEHWSHGQPTGIRTVATPFMEQAAQETRHAQDAAVAEGVRKAIKKALG